MRIGYDRYLSMFKDRTIDKATAIDRIEYWWCGQMEGQGYCDNICEITCKEHLTEVMNRYDSIDARSPAGLISHLLKIQFGIYADEHQSSRRVEKDGGLDELFDFKDASEVL